MYNKKNTVIITVAGGGAEIAHAPNDINVFIVDYDMMGANDSFLCPFCGERISLEKHYRKHICEGCGMNLDNPLQFFKQKPEQVASVFYDPVKKFWIVAIAYDNYETETITFNSEPFSDDGFYSTWDWDWFDIDQWDEQKTWSDLSEFLQDFVIDYISVSMGD